MRAISNPDRLMLIWQLGGGHSSVSELAQLTEIRQPNLSQQLSVLRQAGLVTAKRDGKLVCYSLSIRGERALKLAQAVIEFGKFDPR